MKCFLKPGLAVALTVLAAAPLAALADSEDAFCELRENGEQAKNATGYCTISLEEDRIRIRLVNDAAFDLEPGREAGRFRDQDGNEVEHTVKPDGSHYYTWAHRDITVYFNRVEGLYN